MAAPGPLRHGAALGAVSGVRTFTAPATLALRGRLGGRATRYCLVAVAAGELAGDKHPAIPARTDAPALGGRNVSGALVGRTVAGPTGAAVGAAAAAAATVISERARSLLQARTGLPDLLYGLAEDAIVLGAAAACRGRPRAGRRRSGHRRHARRADRLRPRHRRRDQRRPGEGRPPLGEQPAVSFPLAGDRGAALAATMTTTRLQLRGVDHVDGVAVMPDVGWGAQQRGSRAAFAPIIDGCRSALVPG